MRILLLFLFSLTTNIAVCAQEMAEDRPAGREEAEVARVQDALIDAYIHRDIAALDRILADEYSFIDADGVLLTKRQILDSFSSGDDQLTSYKRQGDRVRVYGNMAVTTSRCQTEETYKGQDESGDLRLTRIFVKRDGRWRLVAGQETKVSSSEPAAASTKDVLALKQLEQDRLDAYREGDADKMSKILADDFAGRWADGTTQNKQEQLRAIRAGEEKHSAKELVESNVRLYGDTAIVTGMLTEQSTLEGRDGSGTISFSDVFVKRGGRWRVVASETKRIVRQPPSSDLVAREHLLGSWKQVSVEEVLPNGNVVHPDEIGFLTYDASGHMSSQVMRRSESEPRVPSDDVYLSNGYQAFFGTYIVDEDSHTVTHHVEGSMARHLVDKDLVSSFEFSGRRLILKSTDSDQHRTVVLEKIQNN